MSQETFLDFGQVDAVSAGGNYFNPGQYTVKVMGAELGETPTAKTKYLAVTFEHEDGRKHVEKFFLAGKTQDSTKKMLGRLQLLHEGLHGMPIAKNFSSYEELATIFDTSIKKAKKKLNIILGGQESNGKIYSKLLFGGFISDDPSFEEKEYAENSPEWKKVVEREKAPVNNNLILNPALATDTKLPWED